MDGKTYVGDEGMSLSVDTFGYSADPGKVMERFGFTIENIVAKYKQL